MIKKIIKEIWPYMVVVLFIILLFHFVINSSLYDYIIKIDNTAILLINDFRSDNLTMIFKSFTYFGNIYIPLIIILFLLLFIKNKWVYRLQSFSYIFSGVITYLAKLLIARPRPVSAIIDIPNSYSFPSGHTLTSIVFYVILVYLLTYNCKKDIRNSSIFLSFVFALLIAFSRVYLGVHYLSDIIGGIIISIPILLMIINIINKHFDKKLSKK